MATQTSQVIQTASLPAAFEPFYKTGLTPTESPTGNKIAGLIPQAFGLYGQGTPEQFNQTYVQPLKAAGLYGADRIAGLSDTQTKVGKEIGTMATPGQFATGTDYITGLPSITDAGVLAKYMSPYYQGVVDVQQRKALEDAKKAQLLGDLGAARKGQLGGSAQILAGTERERSLQNLYGDIQAKGLQDAYTQAMGQFNQSQAQNLAAQQLNAQQQQFGAGLGLQGLQTAMTGAKSLADIGQTQYGQNIGLLDVQNRLGTQQQGQVQSILNNQYQDYLNAQNYPYKQMGFMSDMIRGLPLAQQSSTMFQAPASPIQQAAGLAITGKALGAFAKGGEVEDIDYRDKPAGLADLAVYNMG